MRHRYFVRTQYGIIKIKSLSYTRQATKMSIAKKKLPKLPKVCCT
ncbi:hypothetical protein ARSQ2_02490 [Arsenophonus endosymbiont of Bemisia tabaci Q2]|nr:hypothetical protein ARSQ2_02490 [Arsenophonus endosymbiont of Bemisia tabaci Q2]